MQLKCDVRPEEKVKHKTEKKWHIKFERVNCMGNQAWGGQNIIKQIDGFVLIFLPQKNNQ